MKLHHIALLLACSQRAIIVHGFSSTRTLNISSSSRKFPLKFSAADWTRSTSYRDYSSNNVCLMKAMSSSSTTTVKLVASLVFDNRNLRELPVDEETRNFPRQVQNAISSRCQPTPVRSPDLIACSIDALQLLGLHVSDTQESAGPSSLPKDTKSTLEEYFSGNALPPGSETSAHCYCGHQFGNFAGQLGDGAAISLGEVINSGKRWELQLKGAGLTPFSRTADGRKVLRSSVREFLGSEAMHFLNIPSTRAATLITSGSTVQRDPFYDGGVLDEKCTIVSRIAPNFFRFGSFEIFKKDGSRKGPSAGNERLKKQLLDHVLTYYPSINDTDLTETERYAALYTEVTKRTAELAARLSLSVSMGNFLLVFVHPRSTSVTDTNNKSCTIGGRPWDLYTVC
jgi:serine/tyrosine/threonine adenylyltransferase